MNSGTGKFARRSFRRRSFGTVKFAKKIFGSGPGRMVKK
jgi:hypothetical protein